MSDSEGDTKDPIYKYNFLSSSRFTCVYCDSFISPIGDSVFKSNTYYNMFVGHKNTCERIIRYKNGMIPHKIFIDNKNNIIYNTFKSLDNTNRIKKLIDTYNNLVNVVDPTFLILKGIKINDNKSTTGGSASGAFIFIISVLLLIAATNDSKQKEENQSEQDTSTKQDTPIKQNLPTEEAFAYNNDDLQKMNFDKEELKKHIDNLFIYFFFIQKIHEGFYSTSWFTSSGNKFKSKMDNNEFLAQNQENTKEFIKKLNYAYNNINITTSRIFKYPITGNCISSFIKYVLYRVHHNKDDGYFNITFTYIISSDNTTRGGNKRYNHKKTRRKKNINKNHKNKTICKK